MSDTSTQTYANGAFNVSQKTIDEGDGRLWLELELQVSSGPVRVPVREGQLRQAELRAEALCLAAITLELQKAAEPEDEQ